MSMQTCSGCGLVLEVAARVQNGPGDELAFCAWCWDKLAGSESRNAVQEVQGECIPEGPEQAA